MSANKNQAIEFVPSGRGKARCAADPRYPKGIAVPCPPEDKQFCFVELPYPAPECGFWLVSCSDCGSTAAITAAGRADDPVSFYMPCKQAS